MIKRSLLTSKWAILSAAAAVIIVVGGVYAVSRNSSPAKDQPADNPTAKASTAADQLSQIDNSPPTAAEKDQANSKDTALQQINNDKNSGKITVTPVIVSVTTSDPIVIHGYVSGVSENGGTCTATLTKGASTVTATSQGMADASTTNCSPISIDRSKLPSGAWQVTISYSSSAGQGTSSSETKQLP